jgi:hypothetical protein
MMDSYHNRVIAEIETKLDARAEAGEPLVAKWISNEICNDHRGILPDSSESDFWLWTGYQYVRELVRKQINKRAGDRPAEKPERQQFVFPGFDRDHLQDYYMVEREGDEIGVPVIDLTDEELDRKASHYRAMGATCYAHADEIQRFKQYRSAARSA